MSDIKLFNKGQREIVVEGGVIKPQQTVAVDKEEGEKLAKLFAGELVDVEAEAKSLKADKKIKSKKDEK